MRNRTHQNDRSRDSDKKWAEHGDWLIRLQKIIKFACSSTRNKNVFVRFLSIRITEKKLYTVVAFTINFSNFAIIGINEQKLYSAVVFAIYLRSNCKFVSI